MSNISSNSHRPDGFLHSFEKPRPKESENSPLSPLIETFELYSISSSSHPLYSLFPHLLLSYELELSQLGFSLNYQNFQLEISTLKETFLMKQRGIAILLVQKRMNQNEINEYEENENKNNNLNNLYSNEKNISTLTNTPNLDSYPNSLLYNNIHYESCACIFLRGEPSNPISISEIKRLYIKNKFRQRQFSHHLIYEIILFSRYYQYERIRLDGLYRLQYSYELYHNKWEFYEIPQYIENPADDGFYLEFSLKKKINKNSNDSNKENRENKENEEIMDEMMIESKLEKEMKIKYPSTVKK